jgi:Fe-S-cluster containining protein
VTAGCARCGGCCENIICDTYDDAVLWTTARLADVPDPAGDEGWPWWLEHGWSDDQRGRGIRCYDPAGRKRADADFLAAHWKAQDNGRYACDAFDPVTRLCTAHDARPPVCRDYPWYGEEPSAERAQHMGATCSYLWDLPRSERPDDARPLIPLTVI